MTPSIAVIAALCLPADARVDQRVPKKLLVENGAPTAADKRQINEGIEELMWIAALKPATIGVPAYRDDTREYLEIAVISATLRAGAKIARLTELIHRAIPYPVFLILNEPLGTCLSLCHLRWSQGQSGQTVLDGPLVTANLTEEENRRGGAEGTSDSALSPLPPVASSPFLSSLSLTAQPRQDLHAFYEGWVRCFEAFAAARLTSTFTLCETPSAYHARREALVEHQRLTQETSSLRARAAKETQLNRRVELNLQLKQLEARLTEQKSRLLPT
ncbi:DUF4391 domain-containing protein [soil metagenome]